MKINPIHNICNELLKEQSWRYTDLASEPTSRCFCQNLDVRIFNQVTQSGFLLRSVAVDVAHTTPYCQQGV